MKDRPPGVWITGPSRSGTSLVAGIFAQHGLFFGNTGPPDEHNEKGYFEHPEIIHRTDDRIFADWPAGWWKALEADGWDGIQPWAIKRGPRAWPWVELLQPSLIVLCRRPLSQVLRSRKRRWPDRTDGRHSVKEAEALLRQVARKAACPVRVVNTAGVMKGDFARLALAFDTLDLEFHADLADAWIDPAIWNRGPVR